MRSSNRSADARRFLQLLLIAALVIVGRAPFLLHADRFSDSGEAVEGLMASHVLRGERPALTLACFALFVCLQYVLVERLFSRAIAWMATAFLILGPPSLVLWSLSASAEVVMTLLAGTIMCLGIDIWRRTGRRAAFAAACAAAAFGLWMHGYIIYYWIALGLAILHALPQRRKLLGHLAAAREIPTWLRLLTAVLAVAAAACVALGAAAFLTGGFDAAAFGIRIGVHHPQKLWSIAAALLIVVVLARVFSLSTRQSGSARSLVYAAALAFAAGYAPALAVYAAGGGSPPVARTDLAGIAAAISPFVRQIVPIVLGLRSPATGWLRVPFWLGLPLVFAIVASFVALRERPFTPLFHFLVFTTPLVFLLSGAFVDAQSYRYLMPVSGGLAVVLALGVWRIFRWSRVAGTIALTMGLTLFGLEQRAWYRELAAGTRSTAIISGLDQYPLSTAQALAQPSPPGIPARMGLSCTQDTPLSR